MQVSKIALCLALAVVMIGCGAKKDDMAKQDAEIHYKLAHLHFVEGEYNASLKESRIAVDLDPTNHEYHHLLALNYFIGKDMHEKASVHFEKALSLKDDYVDANMNYGALKLDQGDWDGAIPHFERVLEDIFYASPERAYNNLGWAYYKKGDYKRALKNFKKAVDLSADFVKALNNLGLVYYKLGRLDQSEVALKKAVELAPDFSEAHFNLGLTLMKNKNKASALKSFERVVELDPGSDRARSARDYIKLIK